jgi:polysaccharide pyruvyl transferase WcaK-like protein
LIESIESKEGITIENYRFLIKGILDNSTDDIALIPHVVKKNNDDRTLLEKLYNEFKESGRVYLIEDQNCMQLKDVISKCKIFVGARTHATIAAYSTCVPTFVVGYSVKAKGIAKDLFGSYDKYVIPVQNLKNKDDVYNSYCFIADNYDKIKEHLQDIMPKYIERAFEAKKLFEGDLL